MKVGIISIFPQAFQNIFSYGVGRRALQTQQIVIEVCDLRLYSPSKRVDDYPYGGGKGMVMSYLPFKYAIQDMQQKLNPDPDQKETLIKIFPSPAGKRLTQERIKSWVGSNLIFLCGRYEGIDQRIIDQYVDEEVSVGDFIVSGGELPTMMILDAIVRLLPNVLGNSLSLRDESFEDNLLSYPLYTRPYEVDNLKVPEILMSGHHQKIQEWRQTQRTLKTLLNRKDLLKK